MVRPGRRNKSSARNVDAAPMDSTYAWQIRRPLVSKLAQVSPCMSESRVAQLCHNNLFGRFAWSRLDARCSMLNAQCSMLNARRSLLVVVAAE